MRDFEQHRADMQADFDHRRRQFKLIMAAAAVGGLAFTCLLAWAVFEVVHWLVQQHL